MAKGVNRVALLGNMGRAPEVRTTGGGTMVATFSLATARGVKDEQTGKWVDVTDWHNCVAFGRMAEILRDYTGKGAKLYIEGRLQTRSWDDKESGKKQYRTEVVVTELSLLGKPQQAERAADENEFEGYAYHRGGEQAQTITDDDIPF